MGRMKEVFHEIYEKFDGEIPEDYTIGDYIAEVNENKRLHQLQTLKPKEDENINNIISI
jgi:hypothetical protein